MTGTEECDWKEDAPLENGNYQCRCIVPGCGVDFIGHKRRHVCRRCYMSAKATYDRMTPEQQAEHDRKIREEVEQFMSGNDQGMAAARGGLNQLETLSPSPSPPCSSSSNRPNQ